MNSIASTLKNQLKKVPTTLPEPTDSTPFEEFAIIERQCAADGRDHRLSELPLIDRSSLEELVDGYVRKSLDLPPQYTSHLDAIGRHIEGLTQAAMHICIHLANSNTGRTTSSGISSLVVSRYIECSDLNFFQALMKDLHLLEPLNETDKKSGWKLGVIGAKSSCITFKSSRRENARLIFPR